MADLWRMAERIRHAVLELLTDMLHGFAAHPPFEGDGSYQCTPFMRFAMAICSMDAFSLGSFSPLAAAESGNTL